MLIKPFIKANIKSLPSNTSYSSEYHPAYFGTEQENKDTLEIEGRLLMLPIMYKEWSVIQNKRIHNSGLCERHWAICECQFAEHIRKADLE